VGNLYGTTSIGGGTQCLNYYGSGCGTVFEIDPSGTETILYRFAGSWDGAVPYAGLVRDIAGNLYGTTTVGGGSEQCYTDYNTGCGTVFRLDTSGKETILHSFAGDPDGEFPYGGLVQDAAGNLYGTTAGWGGTSAGTVFKLDTTNKETVLYSFAGSPDGAVPYGGLVRDAAGNLYGTTSGGGTQNLGAVFRLDTTNKETVLYSFAGSPDGRGPFLAGLILDASGNLYGTTVQGGRNDLGTVFKLDTTGKETVLYSFMRGSDGLGPFGSLVRDGAGNLYGTTFGGGIHGLGTVFKLGPSGKETVLHSFAGGTADGEESVAGLIRDAAGNLYGTTPYGGRTGCIGGQGNNCGTVFKIDTSGKETVLYDFCSVSGCIDGENPYGGLVRDTAGNLYGTTFGGGIYGLGTVFKLDTTGTETVLYSFTVLPDGAHPGAGLVRDKAGNLYGTTDIGGGTGCGGTGCGTVFKVDPTGKETVLGGFPDGYPYTGLLRDKAGNLYGTTSGYVDGGTVFKLDPSGKKTVLYYFAGGENPQGVLIQDKAGNLYGTTEFDAGGVGYGTVFKLDPGGTLTVLHSFTGGTRDGAMPAAGLTRDAAGNLYGATQFGGSHNAGTVFKLTP
jgi:uncharacterized repeat protein (TIGR03803 family)